MRLVRTVRCLVRLVVDSYFYICSFGVVVDVFKKY